MCLLICIFRWVFNNKTPTFHMPHFSKNNLADINDGSICWGVFFQILRSSLHVYKKFSFGLFTPSPQRGVSRIVTILGNIFMLKMDAVRWTEDRVNCMEISKLCDKREDKWSHDGKHGGLLSIYASPTRLTLCHHTHQQLIHRKTSS